MKVDPKNTKKRPIYDIKLFYATRCDHNLLNIDSILKCNIDFSNFEFYACLRRGVMSAYGHIILGLSRPFGAGIT